MEKFYKKPLKILILTDRLTLGGAETHILTLAECLEARGHSVTVASSGGALASAVKHEKINLSSHSPRLILSFFALLRLARREKFDIIHSHARAASLVGSAVAKILKIPFVTTVHARFALSPLRRVFSRWGLLSVAVSEDLREYLSRHYSVSAENITVIENGLDFSKYKVRTQEVNRKSILFLSRLDNDCSLCAELLCSIAPRLAERYPDIKITIGGGGNALKRIKSLAETANSALGREVISLLGDVRDVKEFLAQGSAFVGVSRSALEALAAALPVIIAGNEGFLGHLTKKNFDLALATNFCARGEQLPSEEKLFEELCALLDNYLEADKRAYELRERAQKALDAPIFADKHESFYRRALTLYQRKSYKRAKTLLFGYYGFSNLGDDALLRAAISRAEREFGKGVAALANKPRRASQKFLIPCFSRLSPFTLFYRILRCERIIFGGGTLFQDLTSRRSLIFYIFVLQLALFLKKDVILYANGVGNIRSKRLADILFASLSRCSRIGVRDEFSLSLLQKRLLPTAQNKIIYENDLALALTPTSKSRAELLLRLAFKNIKSRKFHHSAPIPSAPYHKFTPCATFHTKNPFSSTLHHKQGVAEIPDFFIVCPRSADRFTKFELCLAIREQIKKGLVPLFIPCSPEDNYISHVMLSKFGGGILQELSFSDLIAIMPHASFLISMRFHPLLAAKQLSIPSVSIGNDPKLVGLESFPV